jgi:hypothetical protein
MPVLAVTAGEDPRILSKTSGSSSGLIAEDDSPSTVFSKNLVGSSGGGRMPCKGGAGLGTSKGSGREFKIYSLAW